MEQTPELPRDDKLHTVLTFSESDGRSFRSQLDSMTVNVLYTCLSPRILMPIEYSEEQRAAILQQNHCQI